MSRSLESEFRELHLFFLRVIESEVTGTLMHQATWGDMSVSRSESTAFTEGDSADNRPTDLTFSSRRSPSTRSDEVPTVCAGLPSLKPDVFIKI